MKSKPTTSSNFEPQHSNEWSRALIVGGILIAAVLTIIYSTQLLAGAISKTKKDNPIHDSSSGSLAATSNENSESEKKADAKNAPTSETDEIQTGEIQENGKTDDENDEPKKMTERERRLKSLAKAVEKEERPETPKFDGAAARKKNGNVTFDDIKFEMEKTERFNRKMLTDEIRALVGQRIKIKGYIRPSIRQKGLKKFVFVRDDKECCFGPGAALFDCILVTLSEGEKSNFTVRPISIEGEFYVKEYEGHDGRIWAVYRMKDSVVR